MSLLSIIVPVLDDLSTGYIQKQVSLFEKFPMFEICFVDGGSSDGTIQFLIDSGYDPIILEKSNRAQRINEGILKSTGEMLLIHHPRSVLTQAGLTFLNTHKDKLSWGGFSHRFDNEHPLLRFTSWYSNEVRAKIRSIVYLDHCIYFKRIYLQGKGLPELPIFEDTALSEILSRNDSPYILPFPSITSAIRFERNGLLVQIFLNQIMKLCWYLKISTEKMNRIYEKGLELNNRYRR